ncbi:MAG: hypothetical protein WAZ18_01680 [Alphaproteobacteria bacterium]
MPNQPPPHVEPANRSEMVIVYAAMVLYGMALGVGIGWMIWA